MPFSQNPLRVSIYLCMSPALFPRDAGYVRIVTEKAPRREGHGASLFLCYALTAENRKREVDGLLDALSFFKMGHGLILTYNQHDKFSVGDKTIEALPVSEYFKD